MSIAYESRSDCVCVCDVNKHTINQSLLRLCILQDSLKQTPTQLRIKCSFPVASSDIRQGNG